jgi:hypothetical protein
MKISFAAVIAAALTLSGCNTLPTGAPQIPISADDVFQAIACEFEAALTADPRLQQWGGGVDLDFGRTDNVTVAAGVTWSAKVSGATLSAGPSGNASRNVESHAKTSQDFTPLTRAEKRCPGGAKPGFYQGLGLADAILRDLATLSPALRDDNPTYDSKLTYAGTFTVVRAAGGGLTFDFGPLSFDLTGNKISSTDKNVITIALIPSAKKDPIAIKKAIRKELDDVTNQRIITDAIQSLNAPD